MVVVFYITVAIMSIAVQFVLAHILPNPHRGRLFLSLALQLLLPGAFSFQQNSRWYTQRTKEGDPAAAGPHTQERK